MGAWYVYIVECRDSTYYTGITVDVARRVAQHNSGKGARYTRTRGPVRLLWSRRVRGQSAALKEEARIKRLPKSAKQQVVTSKLSRGRRGSKGRIAPRRER